MLQKIYRELNVRKLHQTAHFFFFNISHWFDRTTTILCLLPQTSFTVISSTVKNFSQLLNLFSSLRNPFSTSPTSFKSLNWSHLCLFAPLSMFPLGKHSASSLPEASCQGIFPLVFLQIRSNFLGKKGERLSVLSEIATRGSWEMQSRPYYILGQTGVALLLPGKRQVKLTKRNTWLSWSILN